MGTRETGANGGHADEVGVPAYSDNSQLQADHDHARQQRRVPGPRESGLAHNGHSREPSLQFFLHSPLLPPPEAIPLLSRSDSGVTDNEGDLPLSGLPPARMAKREAWLQLEMGLPISSMNIFDYLAGLVSIAFVGHLGAAELAGAAMAYSLANVSGFAVLEGTAGAMETLCGQAYGASQFLQLGVFLQRMLLLLTLMCLPISALWFRADHILLLLGQDPAIATLGREYIVYLIPGLFAAALLLPIAKFMQAQGVMHPMAIISALSLVVHIPLNYLLIYKFGLGLRGGAIASSISDYVVLSGILAYLHLERTGILERTWGGFTWEVFSGWPTMLALAIPDCLMTCLEWWFFEIITFMSGWLPNPEISVAAMTICFQTAGLCFMLPLGLSTAISVRVSNELGAVRPGRARLAVMVSVLISLAIGGALAVFLLLFRREWALLFASPSETRVIAMVAGLMPLLVVSQLGIGLETILSGVLRGSGQQLAGSILNFLAFYFMALPASYWLAFKARKSVEGLWLGVMVGVVAQITSTAAIVWFTDWKHQAQLAADRVGVDGSRVE